MRAQAPKNLVGGVTLEGRCRVDDPTIAAGETLEGALERMIAGYENNPLIEARTNEVVQFSDVTTPEETTGSQLNFDLLPTTATEFDFMLYIPGPFNFGLYTEPEILIEITPIDEWASITAFTLSARVRFEPYQGGVPYYVKRVARSAGTSFSIDIGDDPAQAIYVRVGADDALSETYLYDQFGRPLVQYATAARQGALVSAWGAYKKTAPDPTPNTYLINNIHSQPFPNRRLQLELLSSQTVLLFVLGPTPA
jgi:hypothetical protein